MLRKIINTLALSACIMLASCTDSIDIDFKNGTEYLVIAGSVTNEHTTQPVRITRSTPIASNEKPPYVSGALVTVSDSEGNEYAYTEKEDGVYEYTSGFEGVIGREYTLGIKVDTNSDGALETFTASDIMGELAVVERIKLEKYKFLMKDFVLIIMWGRLPEGGNNIGYCVNVTIGGGDGKKPYSDILLLKDELTNMTALDSIPFFHIEQNNALFQFRPGNKVNVNILSPSESYYKFLYESNDNMSSDIPIFGGPPANSSTNIRQTGGTNIPIAGFFAACPRSRISLTIDDDIVE